MPTREYKQLHYPTPEIDNRIKDAEARLRAMSDNLTALILERSKLADELKSLQRERRHLRSAIVASRKTQTKSALAVRDDKIVDASRTGATVSEIAMQFGLSIATVKSRIREVEFREERARMRSQRNASIP